MRAAKDFYAKVGSTRARRIGLWAGAAAGVFVLFALILFGVLKAVEPTFPPVAELYTLNRPEAVTFLDENGKTIGVRGAVVGQHLKLSEMPSYLPAAFMAMEDRDFYHHHGVSLKGLARAFWIDLTHGHVVQGGSTITQQLVKILLLTPDRTMSRKFVEISGALALERRLTKNQILELYLNRIYLGSGTYGVDGAAHLYFGKSARNVTLSEAAMLAALTSAPSTNSPRRDLLAAQARADLVLTQMVATGALKKSQVAYARAHPATIIDPAMEYASGYFLDAAYEEVKNLLPGMTGDISIQTTMDPKMQQAGHANVAAVLNRSGAKAKASEAALVAMTPDGAVRALIGGRDYLDSTYDRALNAQRQPGSAFKAFVYLAALENGLTPDTVRTDQPISIKDWSPDNYESNYLGPVTLRQAFAESLNSVAVQLGQEVGMQSVIAVARRLGITSPLAPNASLALGTSEVTPLELTASYTSFASLGFKAQPYFVREIDDPKGAVLYRRAAPPPSRVISENNALMMNEMFYEVVQSGTGRAAAVSGHEVAGKTGTSADYRDAWFVGFSPDLVTGVWVGNDDSSPMKNVTGGSLPSQIWSGFMRVALQGRSDLPLPRAEPAATEGNDDDAAKDTAKSKNDAQSKDANSKDGGMIERGLDGMGRFFERMFDGDSTPAPSRRDEARPRRQSDDADGDDQRGDRYSDVAPARAADDDEDRFSPPQGTYPPPPAEARAYYPPPPQSYNPPAQAYYPPPPPQAYYADPYYGR